MPDPEGWMFTYFEKLLVLPSRTVPPSLLDYKGTLDKNIRNSGCLIVTRFILFSNDPDLGKLVTGSRQDALAVGAPGDAAHATGVPFHLQHALPGGGVPDGGRLVPRSRQDARPVGAPGDAGHITGVSS